MLSFIMHAQYLFNMVLYKCVFIGSVNDSNGKFVWDTRRHRTVGCAHLL